MGTISSALLRKVTAELYERSLKKIPEDTKLALARARSVETNQTAGHTLDNMIASARAAEEENHFVCSDSGIPVYFMKVGTQVNFDGPVKQAITDGFSDLVASIQPPMLAHVTNPLTLERGYAGKDMPITTFEMIDDADYVEITCSPKALGSGRWAALEIFTFPTLDVIERYVMDVVLKAGPQHCPPVVIGVGIGGTFDYAAKLAKQAMLRQIGTQNPDPILAQMESRLYTAVNATGFGPMGTGGDATAMAVHVDYASGHGFTPVAVCFNCWINRRRSARIYPSGHVEYFE
ncbi:MULTISPECIES: fumarate hydratase [unclassified Pseudomonas]|uniref:fumarate hydratase n=1 Tax=unclassified Pseudomonas TaxID=196821 RepID=UPI000BC63665|nr:MULTISPECIES: fumarate hydratase [unclassified Pseudomonas]PVZ10518.1 fumarate hydratase subunit alpha [Pseudomonas sp. URIL14HWK12:I12]PVZ21944.1 fumarate hydratase subunit alpha [Pseudomonas sp. URIL14HWK12:I10]PVZ30973.1 fumarate hydratase subunit alpha [Pseudomonas sp. URIL14HWK12:I11]SNZ17451.1 fumarate hydratase subunit alpha [Pseudomonas sp. URIL14HWK12:I9]